MLLFAETDHFTICLDHAWDIDRRIRCTVTVRRGAEPDWGEKRREKEIRKKKESRTSPDKTGGPAELPEAPHLLLFFGLVRFPFETCQNMVRFPDRAARKKKNPRKQ